MPDVLFNLLLLFSAVVFLGVFLRAWRVTRAQRRSAGIKSSRGPPGRSTRVVLATAHRDHDPMNNEASNLAALCQRCHILHDKAEHLRRQQLTYLARRAIGDLFTGVCPSS